MILFCLFKDVKVSQKQVLYSLYGVVEHSGRLNNGHYTAYVKARPSSTNVLQFMEGRDTNHHNYEKVFEAIVKQREDAREEDMNESTAAASHNDGDSQTARASPHKEGGEIQPPSGRWFYISDSRVNEVSEATVLKCQAYMLFYERFL